MAPSAVAQRSPFHCDITPRGRRPNVQNYRIEHVRTPLKDAYSSLRQWVYKFFHVCRFLLRPQMIRARFKSGAGSHRADHRQDTRRHTDSHTDAT
eukprot:5099028-Amphidinium_carterae.4